MSSLPAFSIVVLGSLAEEQLGWKKGLVFAVIVLLQRPHVLPELCLVPVTQYAVVVHWS